MRKKRVRVTVREREKEKERESINKKFKQCSFLSTVNVVEVSMKNKLL